MRLGTDVGLPCQMCRMGFTSELCAGQVPPHQSRRSISLSYWKNCLHKFANTLFSKITCSIVALPYKQKLCFQCSVFPIKMHCVYVSQMCWIHCPLHKTFASWILVSCIIYVHVHLLAVFSSPDFATFMDDFTTTCQSVEQCEIFHITSMHHRRGDTHIKLLHSDTRVQHVAVNWNYGG